MENLCSESVSHVPSVCGFKGGSTISDQGSVGCQFEVSDSSEGETRGWDAASALCDLTKERIQLDKSECVGWIGKSTEARQLPVSQESDRCCSVCDKRRRLYIRWYQRQRFLEGKKVQDFDRIVGNRPYDRRRNNYRRRRGLPSRLFHASYEANNRVLIVERESRSIEAIRALVGISRSGLNGDDGPGDSKDC